MADGQVDVNRIESQIPPRGRFLFDGFRQVETVGDCKKPCRLSVLCLKCLHWVFPYREPLPSDVKIELPRRVLLNLAPDEDTPGIDLMIRLHDWLAISPAVGCMDVFPD